MCLLTKPSKVIVGRMCLYVFEANTDKVYSAPNSAIDLHLVDSSVLPVTSVIERIYLGLQSGR